MADLTGLTIVKQFLYRANAEEWSNTYYLTGDVPADATEWRTLFDALVAQEKTCYSNAVSVIRGYGYDSDADDATAVWSVDLEVAPNSPVDGTLSGAGGQGLAGDEAAWVRWKTDRENTNGKAIYLRKYYHGGYATDGDADSVLPTWIDNLNDFGEKMMDGSFLDARTIRSQHHAEDLQGHGASRWLTTRTLKRRGKRPGA
jgi:hypothetical protein